MDWNRTLIKAWWIALVLSVVGMPASVTAYLTGHMTERVLLTLNLMLSFFAITLAAASALVGQLVKRDVEDS